MSNNLPCGCPKNGKRTMACEMGHSMESLQHSIEAREIKTDPPAFSYVANPQENLFIYSMNGPFRVLAVFADKDEAALFAIRYAEPTVITCFGPLLLVVESLDSSYGASA